MHLLCLDWKCQGTDVELLAEHGTQRQPEFGPLPEVLLHILLCFQNLLEIKLPTTCIPTAVKKRKKTLLLSQED